MAEGGWLDGVLAWEWNDMNENGRIGLAVSDGFAMRYTVLCLLA